MKRRAESLRPSTEQVRLPALGTSASAVAVGQKQGWLNTWVGKGFVKAGYPPQKKAQNWCISKSWQLVLLVDFQKIQHLGFSSY